MRRRWRPGSTRSPGSRNSGALRPPAAARPPLRPLAAAGARAAYGSYEALDYTGARLPEGARVAVVRTYMAHHQGMLLVALANVLHAGGMRARFHSEPRVQAAELDR